MLFHGAGHATAGQPPLLVQTHRISARCSQSPSPEMRIQATMHRSPVAGDTAAVTPIPAAGADVKGHDAPGRSQGESSGWATTQP